jgi:hypothetical protein
MPDVPISEREPVMPQESIVDTSRPSPGRIYDYLLGGSHNFEVDRGAAEELIKLFPFLPKTMRLQRWCLHDLAMELTERRGFDVIIDFASGLPTNDHIHHVVPKGTTVIYTDYDPVVVEYAHEILKDVPDAYFFQADARQPEELLNRPEVEGILRGRRDVALIHWGVSAFLGEDDISHAAQALYEWSGKKSVWAFNAQAGNSNPNEPGVAKVLEIYRQMGTPFYVRSLDRYLELLKPWRPESHFIPFTEWHGFDSAMMTAGDLQAAGPGGGGYGAYLVK